MTMIIIVVSIPVTGLFVIHLYFIYLFIYFLTFPHNPVSMYVPVCLVSIDTVSVLMCLALLFFSF